MSVFTYDGDAKRFTVCECCGQRKVEWKESMTKGLARSLAKLNKCIAAKGKNEVYTGDVNNHELVQFAHSEKCNWTKLKYHGLVFQVLDKDTHVPIRAVYGITQRGYDFLHNGKQVHKFVWSYQGKISDAIDARSPELVSFEDVVKMSVNFPTIQEFEGRDHV